MPPKKPHEPADREKAIKQSPRKRLEGERSASSAKDSKAKLAARRAAQQALIENRKAAERALARRRPWREVVFQLHEKKSEKTLEDLLPSVLAPEEPTEASEAVEKSLEAIYILDNGGLPDMVKLERNRSSAWVYRVLSFGGFASLISLAAWTGFVFFQPFRGFEGEGLQLAWSGPTAIALGREETFHLAWKNADRNPLNHAAVRLSLPPDFVLLTTKPPATDRNMLTWDLGFVAAQGEGDITVTGVFTGALGTQNAVQAIGTFQPAAYTRDYDALATLPVDYEDTALQGIVDLPPKILSGDTLKVNYHLDNLGVHALQGMYTRVRFPIGFIPAVVATSTRFHSDNEAWYSLGDLDPKASSTIVFAGSFASGSTGDLVFDIESGRLGTDGSFQPMQKTEAHAAVLAGDLTLHAVVNGADTDRTILPGDPLRFTVAYRNTSPETLKDVALQIAFESVVNGVSATGTSLLDWKHLEDAKQGTSTTAPMIQTLKYDKKTIPVLAALAPQAEGTIEFSLPTLPITTSTADAFVRVSIQASLAAVGNVKVNRVVHAQPITLRYRSDADLTAQANYFTEEGAPVGSGPLPPVVGKTTSYRVTWHVHKNFHALQNMQVSAVLPKSATWSEKTMVDAGSIAFDEPSRTVTWSLNQMPDSVNDLEASFEVQLTPQPNDQDRFANLLGESRFQSMDALTGESLLKTKPALTTDLQNDDGARGKGVVRKN